MKKKTENVGKLKLDKTIVGSLSPKEMMQVNGGGTTVKTTHGSFDVDCTTRTGMDLLVVDNSQFILRRG
jgi:hypothetical protein